jgi:hypothetical protein
VADESKQVARDAAEVLRRLVQAVEDGRLQQPKPREVALLRRIEGAAAALDATATLGPAGQAD